MSIEIFKDKEAEKREAEELKQQKMEEERRRDAEVERRIAYLNMAVQVCIARQKPTIDSIFEMAEQLRERNET